MADKDIYWSFHNINYNSPINRLVMYIYEVDEDEEIRIEDNFYYDTLMSELWQKELMEKERRKSCMDKEW